MWYKILDAVGAVCVEHGKLDFSTHMQPFGVSGPAICTKFRIESNGIGPGVKKNI